MPGFGGKGHNARRAAVVMPWNVAYSPLCEHLLTKPLGRLQRTQATDVSGHAQEKRLAITAVDAITDLLKEPEVLKICRDAGIITANVFNVMDGALNKRTRDGASFGGRD